MTLLAVMALVASVLIWASPSSQAQANNAPFADAGTDQTLNPGVEDVDLDGTGSLDVDGTGDAPPGISTGCAGCEFKWEIETGPYDWIEIESDTNPDTATFDMPSEAFVDKVDDSDPQKYEIVVRLTVTDDDGATDSDTVSININQRPVADIQVFAGLRDKTILDPDASTKERYSMAAVIDGPGENGNRDNEWDIMEGAFLQLDASGSTDENPRTGKPTSYLWSQSSLRPSSATGINDASSGNTGQQLVVGDTDQETTLSDSSTSTVEVLPDVAPNAPVTVFYQLTVCDMGADATASACTTAGGRTGASLIRIVIHDTSATPEVSIKAGLTTASTNEGDAAPQSTVGQFTGVENQFLVAAGSTVLLTATVKDDDQAATDAAHSGHVYRWSGAAQRDDDDTTATVDERNSATVRVPADAEDGDTIDVSVTVIDATRIAVTTQIQLLVRKNTPPTAGGVPANLGSIDAVDNPATTDVDESKAGPVIYVHKVTDGFQSRKDGSTVTLRGVGNDADGDSIITAWTLREGPDHAALNTAIGAWITAIEAIAPDANDTARKAAVAKANGTALGTVGTALRDMQEPDKPLFELNGALTDTVSFDVPNLANGKDAGTILLFTAIDSNGVSATQILYVYVSADDDVPSAKAGADQQVDPEAFVRLNGSASSDPDVGDTITYSWAYTGATMDPAPDARSPLSPAEINELDGWILDKAADGTFTYIVNAAGMLTGSSDKLQSTSSAYPYFDAPDLSGFNDLRLTFSLHVADSGGAVDIDGDGATTTADVASLSEVTLDRDLDGDGDKTDGAVTTVNEGLFGLDLNGDGDARDDIDLSIVVVNEANVRAVATDTVTITVVNRYFSGNVPGPDFCANRSLGGAQTHPFDSDDDGVADTCSLNTTRRATVARQNALETLAGLNPTDFQTAVNAVCNGAGFKQANYGDDPDDLKEDVCETGRVSPPPVEVDPAEADVFYSGTINGPDFCANHSLGGPRTYAYDSDDDDVADICSLSTTRREAIARQNGLNSFIESFSATEQTELTDRKRLVVLSDKQPGRVGDEITEYAALFKAHVDDSATAATLDAARKKTQEDRIVVLESKKDDADRYSNAVDAACRALGSQDFGDKASALARDACAPKSGPTGQPLS